MNVSNIKRVLQKLNIRMNHPSSDFRLRTSDIGLPTPDTRLRTSNRHRAIALFFTLTFLNTLIPYNQLWANNNGPNAPEAAAFEPVDATDMVNLVTGDMSYVLPLLNVPSPEGGYPLALSYHAGIAMDQEASWVGLGWSLNPGAINRSVNGYPDDWGKTRVSELFYDEGQTLEQYSFSIGGTLPSGVTLGMSAAWGDYRAWGGVVGYSGVATVQFGSEGLGISGSAGPVSGSLNYNKNGGLSSSIGINTSIAELSGRASQFSGGTLSGGVSLTLSKKGAVANSSVGISFYNKGKYKFSLNGIGATNSQTSTNQNDYYVQDIDRGFNFNAGVFWVGYRHRKYSYSLYKDTNLSVSGTLNLFENSKNDNGTYTRDNNSFMDVKQYAADEYDDIKDWVSSKISGYHLNTEGAISLPNYDNYTVTAQGLSGSLSPQILEEVRLFGKGHISPAKWIDDVTNFGTSYANQFQLGNKVNFYFKGGNSSFFRTQTGKFQIPDITNSESFTDTEMLNKFPILADNTYSSSLIDGNLKKIGNRKRNGNFVETFTNDDILGNKTNGWFIEAAGFSRFGSTPSPYVDVSKGIGAYRITTLDGKTYHYSLPVYHFESFYKNFKDVNDEYSSFFESKKTQPYATHWLLTAITGPDYIDTNNNSRVDESDYGYWVEFEYGKWSDGYMWRSPKEGYKELDGHQTYFWGVKQIYYLDKIKTRTHSALFIKSIRKDNHSNSLQHYEQPFSIGQNNIIHSKTGLKKLHNKEYKTHTYNGPLYGPNGNVLSSGNRSFDAQEASWKYINIPKSTTLKLDKILLLKNEDVSYHKNDSQSIYGNGRKLGKSYYNDGYFNEYYQNDTYLKEAPVKMLRSYPVNRDDAVLDIADVRNKNIDNKAFKVITFDHDYSLGRNLPNSSVGHLTLNKVLIGGKGGALTIPPYQFSYLKPYVAYNRNNIDPWGYENTHPDAWSLNSIKTPVGGTIDIEYEEDSFYAEAAYRNKEDNASHSFEYYFDDGLRVIPSDALKLTGVNKSSNQITVNFDSSGLNFDLSTIFRINEKLQVNWRSWNGSYDTNPYAFPRPIKSKTDSYTITKINGRQSITLDVNEVTKYHEELVTSGCDVRYNAQGEYSGYKMPEGLSNCLLSFEFNSEHGVYTTQNPNGKTGGGLRVKNVKISDGSKEYTTVYDYRDPVSGNISGITSYEPFDDDRLVPYIEEIPSPNVMYEYVTVSSFGNHQNDPNESTIYNFKTLKPYNFSVNPISDEVFSLGDTFKVTRSQKEKKLGYNDARFFKYTIHDATSKLGNLISVKSFNKKDQLVGVTANNYKDYDGAIDFSTGIYQNSFQRVKKFRKSPTDTRGSYYFYSSSKVEYPNILESVKSIQGGFTNTTYYDKHDFLTGQVTESRTVRGDGTIIKSKITPAYAKYGSMGAKVDNLTNKNMLSQTAANLTQIKAGSDWKTIGADITTWNNNWTYRSQNGTTETPSANAQKVWRRHQTFAWKGDVDSNGVYAGYTGDLDGFVWGSTQTNPKWVNTSTINMYDHYSMPLETEDINGNKVATKMIDGNTKVAAVANAGYTEMFYSSAEYKTSNYIGNEIQGGNYQNNVKAHTGTWCLLLNPGNQGFKVSMKSNDKHRAGEYKVSVWVTTAHAQNARIYMNGALKPFNGEQVSAGDWTQLNHYETLSTGDETIYITAFGSSIYADDFRMHPIESTMTSYVYNEWDELTHIIGSNNLATRYEYDDAGRLIKTYVEVVDTPEVTGGFKLQKEIKYNYDYEFTTEEIEPNKLSLSLSIGDRNTNITTVTAHVTGGSGLYEYEFDESRSKSDLKFSSYGAGKFITINTFCPDGRIYYKCWVRDKVTGVEIIDDGNHQKPCNDENPDDPDTQPRGTQTRTGSGRDGQPNSNGSRGNQQ
ncbi:hypothetical protein ABW636_05090 [Aquimarina sp. 2201CG1-2-11]|uniref:hypothetical protein n=1 Tax=Aquimarina discodermiae TaxID=3231043 RepID=UPI003462CC81